MPHSPASSLLFRAAYLPVSLALDALPETIAEDTLCIFCLETAEEAAAFLRRFAGAQSERQLLMVDQVLLAGEHEASLSLYAAVLLDSHFAICFFEALAGKITRLAHSCGAARSEPPVPASPPPEEKGDANVELGVCEFSLLPGLRHAVSEMASKGLPRGPSLQPVVRRQERATFEAGPLGGLITRGRILPLGNTTVKVTPQGKLMGLGLPLSAYRTVGWSATLLCGFCVLIIAMDLIELFSETRVLTSCFSPACYLTVMLSALVLGMFAFVRPPTRCGRLFALHALLQPEAFAFMCVTLPAIDCWEGRACKMGDHS